MTIIRPSISLIYSLLTAKCIDLSLLVVISEVRSNFFGFTVNVTLFPIKLMLYGQCEVVMGVDKTRNMEHPGTFRNIPEHPGTSRKMKKLKYFFMKK